jgi:putative tryptophan/tyrosine transport system substrate-binding protein
MPRGVLNRRDFISLSAGAATAPSLLWPRAARAQQPAMPLIGFFDIRSAAENARLVTEFRQGLAQAGYIEGRNVTIEFRWAEGHFDRLRALAEDLVRRQPAVIVATGAIGTVLAAKAATSTIPIVFMNGSDPVKYGFVASLNRPGGNITGVNVRSTELANKRVEFLSELVPQATTIAFLSGGASLLAFEEQKSNMLAAAGALGRQATVLECGSGDDFERAFAAMVERGAGAFVVGTFPLFFELRNRDRIIALAARHKIPGVYPHGMYVAAGGLMSYAADGAIYRDVGLNYVGRILKGARPADLPVQQAGKFSLAINLKTAKALGLTIPQTLLVAANELIE